MACVFKSCSSFNIDLDKSNGIETQKPISAAMARWAERTNLNELYWKTEREPELICNDKFMTRRKKLNEIYNSFITSYTKCTSFHERVSNLNATAPIYIFFASLDWQIKQLLHACPHPPLVINEVHTAEFARQESLEAVFEHFEKLKTVEYLQYSAFIKFTPASFRKRTDA